MKGVLEITTKKELLGCKKYQRIRFRETPPGKYEVFVGVVSEPSCSCDCAVLVRNPITLMKQGDGIIASKILVLDDLKKWRYAAIVHEIQPTDSNYESISGELNKGVLE